jgi:hypothetical protein
MWVPVRVMVIVFVRTTSLSNEVLFASDPHKMATMQQAIDEIDDGKMTPDELLKAAHFRAVSTLHKQGVHVIAELGSAPQAIVDPFAEAPAHSDGPWTKYQAQPSAKPAYTRSPATSSFQTKTLA